MSVRVHASWAAASAILLTGSRFVLTGVLARKLNTDSFGVFVYAQWLVEFTFLLLTLGATGAVSRYAAEMRSEPARLTSFMHAWRPWARSLPFAAALASALAAMLSGLALASPAIAALILWTFASGQWSMQTAALTGMQRFDLIFKSNAVAAGVMLAGALLLPLREEGIESVFGLMALANIAAFLICFNAVRRFAREETAPLAPEYQKAVKRYALSIWITALLWNLGWSRGELPLVRSLLGDGAVAHYSVAMTLFGGAVAGVMLGVGGVAPQVTRLIGEGRNTEALAMCRTANDIQLLASGLAMLVFLWLAPELLSLAFGKAYADSSRALSILGLGLPVLAVSLYNHYLQIVTNAEFSRNSTLVGVAVLYACAFGTIKIFDIEGAALSRVAALWTMALVAAVWAARSGELAALGVRNYVTVIFVGLVSLAMVVAFDQMVLPLRALTLMGTSLLFLATLRTEVGGLVVTALWKRVRA